VAAEAMGTSAERPAGHATVQETLDTYGHFWPDSEDRTRAAVEAALRFFAVTAPSDASGQ
jgi:hypothetical protein